MSRSEFVANVQLAQAATPKQVQAKILMNKPMNFSLRLAALNASDTNKGKVWN